MLYRSQASQPHSVPSARDCASAQKWACSRQTPARSVVARSSVGRQTNRMLAPEMLWLFEGQHQCMDGGDMQPMLDAVWALQYQIPGAICGFAGEVAKLKHLPGNPSAGFTHAVHLRFAKLQGMASFSTHARLQQTLESEAHPLCASVLEVGFEGCTVQDMEAVFRRGPDWEEGQELLLLLAAAGAAGDRSQQSFLQNLAELAELCGALPASYGPACSWRRRKGAEEQQTATHALMARFRTERERELFIASAPVQALLEPSQSSVLPLSLVLLLAFDVAPPQKSQVMQPPRLA